MESRIAAALELEHPPIALLWADEKPEGALEFVPGRWGCAVSLFASAAARGRPAAIERETMGCPGGAVGLGFGNAYKTFMGGIDCFYRFLSTGNAGTPAAEALLARGTVPNRNLDSFLHGEAYLKTPELAEQFVGTLPMRDIPERYVVFKPLDQVDLDRPKGGERLVNISFVADPDQISALVVLANYGREGTDNVICPMAAGCQSIGILSYAEGERRTPRAVIGLFDLSARLIVSSVLPADRLTFTVPPRMFQQMEADVPGSFLLRETWRELREKRNRAKAG